MVKGNYWIFCIALLVAVAAGAAINDENNALPGQQFFMQLPVNERPDYLSFELGRGYINKSLENSQPIIGDVQLKFPDMLGIPDDLVEKFKALETPENFTDNLFEFVQTEFGLEIPSIRTLILNRTYCFEDGSCFNLDDLGTHCCPF